MDIYGIKKSIQVIEQVFLDMTNVPSVVKVEYVFHGAHFGRLLEYKMSQQSVCFTRIG